MPRGYPNDEHMTLPTWRVRQLQDIEHAARVVVELINAAPVKWPEASLVATAHELLTEALESHQ